MLCKKNRKKNIEDSVQKRTIKQIDKFNYINTLKHKRNDQLSYSI